MSNWKEWNKIGNEFPRPALDVPVQGRARLERQTQLCVTGGAEEEDQARYNSWSARILLMSDLNQPLMSESRLLMSNFRLLMSNFYLLMSDYYLLMNGSWVRSLMSN